MPENLNKTDSRVNALGDVTRKLVTYDPALGEYNVSGPDGGEEIARGALRRTYSELRAAGLIQSSDPRNKSLVRLTDPGKAAAREWGID